MVSWWPAPPFVAVMVAVVLVPAPSRRPHPRHSLFPPREQLLAAAVGGAVVVVMVVVVVVVAVIIVAVVVVVASL